MQQNITAAISSSTSSKTPPAATAPAMISVPTVLLLVVPVVADAGVEGVSGILAADVGTSVVRISVPILALFEFDIELIMELTVIDGAAGVVSLFIPPGVENDIVVWTVKVAIVVVVIDGTDVKLYKLFVRVALLVSVIDIIILILLALTLSLPIINTIPSNLLRYRYHYTQLSFMRSINIKRACVVHYYTIIT